MTCFTPIRGRRMRVTRVNQCGAPVCSTRSFVVSSGFVSIEASPQVDEGEDITVRNAAGEICVSVPACPSMTSVDVTINFCDVDTDLFAIALGREAITDADGNGIGFDICDIPCNEGFALEVWTDVHSKQGVCDPATGAARFGYFVLPWVSNSVLGDFTIEDGAITFSLAGSARSGSGWGRGPYPVQDGAAGPMQLDPPLDPACFGRLLLTEVEPPAALCGAQELPDSACADDITGISAQPDPAEVGVGGTEQLSVFANQSGGGVRDITLDDNTTYTSVDPAIATVDDNGLISGVAEGSTTINIEWVDPDTMTVYNTSVTVNVIT